jgi:hypothetical protein
LIKSRKSGKRETKDSRNKLKSKIQESNILSFTQFVNEALTKKDFKIGDKIEILDEIECSERIFSYPSGNKYDWHFMNTIDSGTFEIIKINKDNIEVVNVIYDEDDRGEQFKLRFYYDELTDSTYKILINESIFVNEAKVTKPNLEILKNVLRSLRDEKVDEFRTQNDLFVFIEIHKFPRLNRNKLSTAIKGPNASYSLSMRPNNYYSILNYLVDKMIIEKAPNRTSKEIKYLVNQEHLIDLDIDNIDGTYDSDNNIF